MTYPLTVGELGELLREIDRKVDVLREGMELQREAAALLEKVLNALQEMPEKLDSVDNGYCTICKGHRLWVWGTPDSPYPGPCENPECWSHKRREALEGAGQLAIKLLTRS